MIADIPEWLLAQYDADERQARAGGKYGDDEWMVWTDDPEWAPTG